VLVDNVGVIDCARSLGVRRRAETCHPIPVDEAVVACSNGASGVSGRQGLSFLMMVSSSRSVVCVAAIIVDSRRVPW